MNSNNEIESKETPKSQDEVSIQITNDRQEDNTDFPPEMEELFLTMYTRKKERELNGPHKKENKYHLVALTILLIMVYGYSSYYGNDEVMLMLGFSQILGICMWVLLCIVITEILSGSKFSMLFNWCAIYWPLIAISSTVLFAENNEKKVGIIVAWAITIEILTVLVFLSVFYGYPAFLTSKFFRHVYGPQRWWNITVNVKDYSFEFDHGFCRNRRHCRYVGPLKDGKPHGKNGIWTDDCYHGEVLSGSWDNGNPIAPFTSREYGGKGNSFSAKKLVFFFASDDKYTSNQLIPTNTIPPRVGVASVECSVTGDFYQHLPRATLLVEPTPEGVGEGNMTVGECIKLLQDDDSAPSEEMTTKIEIDSTDPRGVQIGGHIHNKTGSMFTREANSINIDIHSPLLSEEIDDSNDECYYLEVRDWTKNSTKSALIFFPGFNCWLQHSLEAFGQLLAMTTISEHVYPVVYQWPGGQVPTYRHATWTSASKQNRKNVLQLIRGLKKEGIQNIHFMSHSLGVQTLLSIFEENDIDNEGNTTPSEVSKMFATTNNESYSNDKLVCRSITMLNADFPVGAFIEKAFNTISSITNLITLVGDRADQALFFSQLINGICNYTGYDVPSVLDSKQRREQVGFHMHKVIGRDLDLLYTNDNGSKEYLDLDIIDSTLLETNINGLRHSGFSVNAILLRDLEDIIVSGRRAIHRPSLLHRYDNIFEYCYAPIHVSPK